jgi:hypothetical protein
MNKTEDRSDLEIELEDTKTLLSHLEEEFRKAAISEKSYKEIKEKYTEKIKDMEKKVSEVKDKPEEKKEGAKSESNEENNVTDEKAEAKPEVKKEEGPHKPGFLEKLFGKKNKEEPKEEKKEEKKEEPKEEELEIGDAGEMTPEVIEKLAQQAAAQSGTAPSETPPEPEQSDVPETNKDMEIEKIKVMMDAFRETGKNTDEAMRGLSESIGEIRSMTFQTDSNLNELTSKLSKLEDEVERIKPKELDKKFAEYDNTIEKYQILTEKFEKKSEDLAEKVNKVYEMLKTVGGVENLVDLNKQIQKKLEDIKEATKYIERLSFKAEKSFIDLQTDLQDFIVYKSRLESLEDSSKDLIKAIEAINGKIDNLPTKKDLDDIKSEMLSLSKETDEIAKVLPIVKSKLPENIMELKNQKEDILLLMGSVKDQFKSGKIRAAEYESIKKQNEKKISEIDTELKKEWEIFQSNLSNMGVEKDSKPESNAEQKPAVQPQASEIKTEEKKETTEKSEPVEEKSDEKKKSEEKTPKERKKGKKQKEKMPENSEEKENDQTVPIEEEKIVVEEEKPKIEEKKEKQKEVVKENKSEVLEKEIPEKTSKKKPEKKHSHPKEVKNEKVPEKKSEPKPENKVEDKTEVKTETVEKKEEEIIEKIPTDNKSKRTEMVGILNKIKEKIK